MTVLSGEDLRLASKSIKSNAFVFVRYGVNNFRTTETNGGEGGTCYPKWNEKLVLDLPPHVEAVTLEVHYKIAFGDKIVGTALVPVSDFAGGYMPESAGAEVLVFGVGVVARADDGRSAGGEE
ncbi:hypothetical protein TIFTF001_030365 [Ficus carica]|uniref:C2 domain-containing protein n=1 Tax=Ficus carica TaxID=3494 RepID=A0AA88DT44_FICCA|nr:hypothetical protein TIFTF001_030365 [Ficus carica]